jgi:hypothetical protein
MPRGRLIYPFSVELAQLDTTAIEVAGGYDDEFREVKRIEPVSGSDRGASGRVETIVTLKAQIEPQTFNELDMMASGRSTNSRFGLVFHYADLEKAGVVEASTGVPRLRAPGDRLAAIRNVRSGALIETIPAVPGLFAVEVQSRGFGIGVHRNLCLMIFEERETSARGVGG